MLCILYELQSVQECFTFKSCSYFFQRNEQAFVVCFCIMNHCVLKRPCLRTNLSTATKIWRGLIGLNTCTMYFYFTETVHWCTYDLRHISFQVFSRSFIWLRVRLFKRDWKIVKYLCNWKYVLLWCQMHFF